MASVAAPDVHADRAVLVLGSLTITNPGILDLNANDMIITSGTAAAVAALLATGYNGGAWNGPGIQSSAASSDTTQLTALGSIQNGVNGVQFYGSGTTLGLFDGMNPAANAILVKFTYYGDANLDGTVDGSDYSKIDSAYGNASATGWTNGDFNYDGVVDGSDYTLLDNAFNSQGKQF